MSSVGDTTRSFAAVHGNPAEIAPSAWVTKLYSSCGPKNALVRATIASGCAASTRASASALLAP